MPSSSVLRFPLLLLIKTEVKQGLLSPCKISPPSVSAVLCQILWGVYFQGETSPKLKWIIHQERGTCSLFLAFPTCSHSLQESQFQLPRVPHSSAAHSVQRWEHSTHTHTHIKSSTVLIIASGKQSRDASNSPNPIPSCLCKNFINLIF